MEKRKKRQGGEKKKERGEFLRREKMEPNGGEEKI